MLSQAFSQGVIKVESLDSVVQLKSLQEYGVLTDVAKVMDDHRHVQMQRE